VKTVSRNDLLSLKRGGVGVDYERKKGWRRIKEKEAPEWLNGERPGTSSSGRDLRQTFGIFGNIEGDMGKEGT